MTAAVIGALLSAYPIVFLGKSVVSPALQQAMLYSSLPSVPEYGDTFTEDIRASDTGAGVGAANEPPLYRSQPARAARLRPQCAV